MFDNKGSHPFKKTFFYEKFSQTGVGVSRFSYYYSDFIYPIIYEFIYGKKIWIRISQIQYGGGRHHFVKVFRKKTFFFKGWLPLLSNNCHNNDCSQSTWHVPIMIHPIISTLEMSNVMKLFMRARVYICRLKIYVDNGYIMPTLGGWM